MLDILEIKWNKPKEDPCTVDIVAYDVSVGILDQLRDKSKYIHSQTKTTSFNITILSGKSLYNVSVRARTVAGPGPFSPPYKITLAPVDGESAPSVVLLLLTKFL